MYRNLNALCLKNLDRLVICYTGHISEYKTVEIPYVAICLRLPLYLLYNAWTKRVNFKRSCQST